MDLFFILHPDAKMWGSL